MKRPLPALFFRHRHHHTSFFRVGKLRLFFSAASHSILVHHSSPFTHLETISPGGFMFRRQNGGTFSFVSNFSEFINSKYFLFFPRTADCFIFIQTFLLKIREMSANIIFCLHRPKGNADVSIVRIPGCQ